MPLVLQIALFQSLLKAYGQAVGGNRNKDRFKNRQLCGVWKFPVCEHGTIKIKQSFVCNINPQWCARIIFVESWVESQILLGQSHLEYFRLTSQVSEYLTQCFGNTLPNLTHTQDLEYLTLLRWNTLPNQSSDQHVFLFMYTKEEDVTRMVKSLWAIRLQARVNVDSNES